MAGRGPAPKPKSKRRRSNPPAAGEWIVLPAESPGRRPGLPRPYPPRGGYSAQSKREWAVWWSSPMAHMWDDSDAANLELLLQMIELWAQGERTAALASQIRQMKDAMGLTPKGRQDRRWRLPEAPGSDNGELLEAPTDSPWGHLSPVSSADK